MSASATPTPPHKLDTDELVTLVGKLLDDEERIQFNPDIIPVLIPKEGEPGWHELQPPGRWTANTKGCVNSARKDSLTSMYHVISMTLITLNVYGPQSSTGKDDRKDLTERETKALMVINAIFHTNEAIISAGGKTYQMSIKNVSLLNSLAKSMAQDQLPSQIPVVSGKDGETGPDPNGSEWCHQKRVREIEASLDQRSWAASPQQDAEAKQKKELKRKLDTMGLALQRNDTGPRKGRDAGEDTDVVDLTTERKAVKQTPAQIRQQRGLLEAQTRKMSAEASANQIQMMSDNSERRLKMRESELQVDLEKADMDRDIKTAQLKLDRDRHITQAAMEQKRFDQQQAQSQQRFDQQQAQSQQQMQMMADMMKAAVAAIAACTKGGN